MKRALLLITFFTSLSAWAQTKPIWNVSVGGTFPIGKFSSFSYDPNTMVTTCGFLDENVNGGAASLGFNLGIEALVPLQNHKLSFTISADFNYNGVNSDSKKYLNLAAEYLDNTFRSQVQRDGGSSINSSCVVERTPSYINIPILAGLRYTMPLNDGMDFFAECGIGANLRFITPIKLMERISYLYGGHYFKMSIEEQFKYSMKGSLAFRLGAGVKFTEKMSLSAYYYYLGAGDVSSTIIAQDPNDNTSLPSEKNLQLGTINPMIAVVKLSYYL